MSNTIKFERATVQFTPNIAVDGYRTPAGEFRVGMAGASQALGFADNWLSQVHARRGVVLKTLQGMGYKMDKHRGSVDRTQSGASCVDTISLEDFDVLIAYAILEGKQDAMRLRGIEAPIKPKAGNPEKEVQVRLHSKTGGQTEVECPAGRIDILTPTEIIEVKSVNGWKGALGQVLVYGHYYPSHSKRIHLFGGAQSEVVRMVEGHCSRLGVSVTWD